jgi:hypothetical protein
VLPDHKALKVLKEMLDLLRLLVFQFLSRKTQVVQQLVRRQQELIIPVVQPLQRDVVSI